MDHEIHAEDQLKMEASSHQNEIKIRGRPRKGGLRTMPFIIVNESFEKVASYGLMPNMIFYLIMGYHMDLVNGSSILLWWSAISNALAIVGAFLSDSYLGRYWVIVLGSFSSLLGMIILWLTSVIPSLKPPPCATYSGNCQSATPGQLFILLGSFVLMSIGAGCIRPCSIAFGADQLHKKDDEDKNERTLQSFFNWYYASIGVSTILALTIIVYIQDHLGYKVGFGVPAVLMFCSALMFVIGSSLYVKVKAKKSLFTGIVQVIVATFRKRSLSASANESDYLRGPDSQFDAPTDKMRFLNKACIIKNPEKDLNLDGSAANPWKLCTVDQVESVKALLRVLLIWSTGIMIQICLQSSFGTLQASIMDRHLTSGFKIPAGSFTVFTVLTLTVWVALYDRVIVPLLAKHTGNQRGLSTKLRMGIGLLLSTLALAISAIVEKKRRDTAIDQGLADKPGTVMDMSAMWLLPQYCLLGLAEAFNAIGQIEYFYSQLPKSMSSVAVALFTLGMAVAAGIGSLLLKAVDRITKKGGKESWLSDNLNQGHVDYYYWLITIMSLINFVYYLVCCWILRRSKDTEWPTPKKERVERDGKTQEQLSVV